MKPPPKKFLFRSVMNSSDVAKVEEPSKAEKERTLTVLTGLNPNADLQKHKVAQWFTSYLDILY